MSTYEFPPPPRSEQELLDRAYALAGKNLSEFQQFSGLAISHNLYAKGKIGQLIELLLGANNNALPQPDFQTFHIELKTIPVDQTGKPIESTYLCHAQPCPPTLVWHDSLVYKKSKRILWIPIIGSPKSPLLTRQIGQPLLWTAPPHIEATLKADWEELTTLMLTGQHDMLSANLGQYLQIRPKAANSKINTLVTLSDGQILPIVPKGFYFRRKLTEVILSTHYL
jgi:DNA mismatch repair protein MutH